jgi:hypothetical protein
MTVLDRFLQLGETVLVAASGRIIIVQDLMAKERGSMRYVLKARVRPQRRTELLKALEQGRFGAGFPYGDLGEVLCSGRVDVTGKIRWIEVCYCREYLGVAMQEELLYLEEYLTDIVVADARSPRYCEGYPVCGICDCTRKVRFQGEPLLDYLQRSSADPPCATSFQQERPTRWLGWRGDVTAEEARRNRIAAHEVERGLP